MPLFSLKHSVWFHYTHYNNFIILRTIVVSKRAMREKETGLEKMRKTQRTNYNNIHSWYLGVWFDYPHSIAVLCHGLHSQREKECNGSTHKFGEEFVENEITGHFFYGTEWIFGNRKFVGNCGRCAIHIQILSVN